MKAPLSVNWSLAWLTLCVAFGLLACSREDRADSSELEPAATPPRLEAPTSPKRDDEADDEAVGSVDDHRFSRELEEAHRMADEAGNEEEMTAARRKLEAVYARTPESRDTAEVREDVAARIARIWLRTGSATRARKVAKSALYLRDDPSVTRANLLVVLADAEEMLERPNEARKHLMQALEMNQTLLEKELENP